MMKENDKSYLKFKLKRMHMEITRHFIVPFGLMVGLASAIAVIAAGGWTFSSVSLVFSAFVFMTDLVVCWFMGESVSDQTVFALLDIYTEHLERLMGETPG